MIAAARKNHTARVPGSSSSTPGGNGIGLRIRRGIVVVVGFHRRAVEDACPYGLDALHSSNQAFDKTYPLTHLVGNAFMHSV